MLKLIDLTTNFGENEATHLQLGATFVYSKNEKSKVKSFRIAFVKETLYPSSILVSLDSEKRDIPLSAVEEAFRNKELRKALRKNGIMLLK
jgi:hypothetical protein